MNWDEAMLFCFYGMQLASQTSNLPLLLWVTPPVTWNGHPGEVLPLQMELFQLYGSSLASSPHSWQMPGLSHWGKKGREMKCHSPRPLTCLLMIHITVVTSNTLQLIHIRSFAHCYTTMVGLSMTSWTALHSDQPPFWHHVKRWT